MEGTAQGWKTPDCIVPNPSRYADIGPGSALWEVHNLNNCASGLFGMVAEYSKLMSEVLIYELDFP